MQLFEKKIMKYFLKLNLLKLIGSEKKIYNLYTMMLYTNNPIRSQNCQKNRHTYIRSYICKLMKEYAMWRKIGST